MNKLLKIIDVETNQEIEWSKNCFPDGQVQLKVDKSVDLDKKIKLIISIPTSQMLDLFTQVYAMFKNIVRIDINYLYGARSDKDITETHHVANVANIMRDILTTICNINRQIEILAPHCDTSDWYGPTGHKVKENYVLPKELDLSQYDMVIFPDESAKERFVGTPDNYMVCIKERDQATGKIIKHEIPKLPKNVKKVVVVDDICDGGNSYTNLSKTFTKDIVADLFVFHGVFSNNAVSRLLNNYNKIIVTNSLPNGEEQKANLPDEDKPRVQVIDVWGK